MKTITVDNSFGKPKQITREDFIKTCRDHATQFYLIAVGDETSEVAEMVKTAERIAGVEFDRIYARQEKVNG